MSVSPAKKKKVAERADFLCEYCFSPRRFSPDSFSIEHIQPKSKSGSDDLDNLALACQGCNGKLRRLISSAKNEFRFITLEKTFGTIILRGTKTFRKL
jgi:5-methylcytosine-specific restriction endonuclease McrA